jgi:hypothetical protein
MTFGRESGIWQAFMARGGGAFIGKTRAYTMGKVVGLPESS